MTAHWTVRRPVIGCKLKQNANEGCNSCASLAGLVLSFIACLILLVIALYLVTIPACRGVTKLHRSSSQSDENTSTNSLDRLKVKGLGTCAT